MSSVLGQRPPGAPRGSKAAWKPPWLEQLHKVSKAGPGSEEPAGSPFCPVVGQQRELTMGFSMDPLEGWQGASASVPSRPRLRMRGKGRMPRWQSPLSPACDPPCALLTPGLLTASLSQRLSVWPLTADWLGQGRTCAPGPPGCVQLSPARRAPGGASLRGPEVLPSGSSGPVPGTARRVADGAGLGSAGSSVLLARLTPGLLAVTFGGQSPSLWCQGTPARAQAH